MGNIIFSCWYKYCTNMAHKVKGGDKLTMLQSREKLVTIGVAKKGNERYKYANGQHTPRDDLHPGG